MTTYTLRKGNPASTRTDAVVIGVATTDKGLTVAPGGEPVASAYGRKFAPMLTAMGFGGKAGEVLRVPTGGTISAATLVVVGLGKEPDLSGVRRAAGVAARNLANAASVTLALPTPDAEHVRAVAEGFIAGGYRFAGRKQSAPTEDGLAEAIVLCDAARRGEVKEAFAAAQTIEGVASTARDWVNTPPNELNPVTFAEAIDEFTGDAKVKGLSAHVVTDEELRELGCGGILGVGQGSATRPRLVRLTWAPERPVARIALVGKGITYDSGGLTIKPGSSMTTMKTDMAGAAAVVAAVRAIAELGLPVAVDGYAALAENMPSGTAMRPGDVLTIHGGTTVEITNTDAEGRLVLADAISLAAETEPDAIIEISTLTGACVVALGDRVAGVFGDEDQVALVEQAADAAGELVWPMPIPEHIADNVRHDSKVADLLQHNWVRWGASSYAAAFLTQFRGEVPFVHLDIAGPSWNGGSGWGSTPAGGTGFGVRTLVEYAARLAQSAD